MLPDHDARRALPPLPPRPYSPKCLEEELCELRLNGVLRSSHSPGPTPMGALAAIGCLRILSDLPWLPHKVPIAGGLGCQATLRPVLVERAPV
jgi:hypothetical protein